MTRYITNNLLTRSHSQALVLAALDRAQSRTIQLNFRDAPATRSSRQTKPCLRLRLREKSNPQSSAWIKPPHSSESKRNVPATRSDEGATRGRTGRPAVGSLAAERAEKVKSRRAEGEDGERGGAAGGGGGMVVPREWGH